jgi:DNA 3'-phosphatase
MKTRCSLLLALTFTLGSLVVTSADARPSRDRRRVAPHKVKLRPTPTAPKMTVGQLNRLGVEVLRGRNGKLSARPTASFNAAAAGKLGLKLVQGKRPHLRFVPKIGLSGKPINAAYPTRRRALTKFVAPKRGRVKIAFFDADSTLRVARGGGPTADHAGDIALLPGVAAKVKAMASKGYLIAIVSNQAGVEAGYISHTIAQAALRNTAKLLADAGAPVHYFDYAAKKDRNRKPNATMGQRLAGKIAKRYGKQIDWRRSIMVGDAGYKRGVDTRPDGKPGDDFSNSDRRFADNLRKARRSPKGLTFHHPREFFGWNKLGVQSFRSIKDLAAFIK